MKKILTSLALLLTLVLAPAALADTEDVLETIEEEVDEHVDVGTSGGFNDFNFQDILDTFQEDVQEESAELQEDSLGEEYDTEEGEGLELLTFGEEGEGALSIVAAIQRFLDFFKLIVTPIAILFCVVMGVRMVAAGSESEEMVTKSKNYIRYAIEGLIVIFVADSAVEVFFGAEGDVLRGGESGAQEFGRGASTLFRGIYGLIQVVIGSIAVFMLITAGMRYVGGSASDDQINKAKKQITWALVGLFVIGVSEFVIKDIIFADTGTELGVDEAKQFFAQITNFIAGTIGTLSFLFLFYAGYLYSTASVNEDNAAKAKKIIIGCILGIILALAAFAITSTIVELDAS